MKTILISLLLLASLAIADLPSDQIKYQDAPKAISLQHVDPTSAWQIALSHPELVKEERKPMADLGYLSSEPQVVSQDINSSLENFTQTIPELPASVGNVSENITEINGTLAWW